MNDLPREPPFSGAGRAPSCQRVLSGRIAPRGGNDPSNLFGCSPEAD